MSTPVPLGPFPGGVNLRDSFGALEAEELAVCRNYRLGPGGYLSKRPGFTKFGSSPAKVSGGSHIVNFLHRFYMAGGSKKLLAASDGKFWSINDSTGASTQVNVYNKADPGTAQAIHSSNLMWKFAYKDRLYILDGTQVFRYDGTNAMYAGHFEHAAPTLAQSTGGSLTATSTYKYRISSNAGDMGEGIATGEATITLTGLNNKVNLSNILDAPTRWGETTKRIYRTKANGTAFYFLAEISAGVTTYADTTADTALSSLYIPVHSPKADARFAIVGADGRTYWCGFSGSNASLVEPSDPGFPDRIYDNEFFTVQNNDGDEITGVARTPSGLVFFKRNSMWLSRGFGTPTVNISSKVGVSSSFSITEVPGGIMFLSTRGTVYFYDGVNLNEIGSKIKPELESFGSNAQGRVIGCYHDLRYHLAYDYKGTNGFNCKWLEYDLVGGKWDGPHYNGYNLTPSYFCVFDSGKDNNELLWGEARSSKGSYIYKRDIYSYLDDGNKFLSEIYTGHFPAKDTTEKTFVKAKVSGHFITDTDLEVGVILDGGLTEILVEAITGTALGLPIFGVSLFGSAYFLSRAFSRAEPPIPLTARAKTPRIHITDGGSSTDHLLEEIEFLVQGLPKV